MAKIPKSKRGRKRYILLSCKKGDASQRSFLTTLHTYATKEMCLQISDERHEKIILACDHRALSAMLAFCISSPGVQVKCVSGTLRGLTRNL